MGRGSLTWCVTSRGSYLTFMFQFLHLENEEIIPVLQNVVRYEWDHIQGIQQEMSMFWWWLSWQNVTVYVKLLPFLSCLMLFLVESTCGWGSQGRPLSVAALLNITKAGGVVSSGRDTPQIISKQKKNGGVLVCLIWMCTIQLKLYNELCTIAGWNCSSLNSRNFRACGMWALFMSFPSYLKLFVWKCRKFYHFRHQN